MNRHLLILSFPHSSAMGGGERYLEELVRGLMPSGSTFTLISSSRAMLDVFRARSWDNRPLWCGVEPVTKLSVLIFPLTVPFFLPLLCLTLARFRFGRGTRTVLCLSLTEKLLATLPARLLGMRVIWMEHLVPGRALRLNPYRRAYAALSRLAVVVTVSEAVRDGLAALGVSRSRISIIAPGIAAADGAARATGPIIGIVSRLSKEKNVGFLIKAFGRVAETVPEARLEIYGDGPERRMLERSAESLGLGGRVAFKGFIDSRSGIYAKLRVLTVPSLAESFGIAALEAMASGVPILASRVGGLPELVADGETGRLLPPDDAAAWTAAMLELLQDQPLAARMGEAARARAANRFPLSKTLAAWKTLLDIA